MQTLLVITNCPDDATANTLAQAVIGERLAACANILPPVRSVYHWQGAIETACEIPVFFKSTVEAYPALENRLHELHPYDLPEIIALPIDRGLPAYLNWVADETIQ